MCIIFAFQEVDNNLHFFEVKKRTPGESPGVLPETLRGFCKRIFESPPGVVSPIAITVREIIEMVIQHL